MDKLSLDASFQDNAYLKTYLTFDMMDFMGVDTPLFSYTWVKINRQEDGLFLAIEEIEDGFLRRNYGYNFGKLYKAEYKNLNHDNFDIELIYTDDKFSSYRNLFDNAKVKVSNIAKKRLIGSIRVLNQEAGLEEAIKVDKVLRYFVVQVFVVNLDSYLGKTSHNYFLYEEEGRLSMLPWDYNLAYGTYSLGMPNPINDSNLYINFPIDTPNSGENVLNRPLYHNLMKKEEYFARYRTYFDDFIRDYIESGRFSETLKDVEDLIDEYVKKPNSLYFLRGP